MIRVNIILKTGLEQILTPKKIKTQKHKKGQLYKNRPKTEITSQLGL